MNLQIMLSELQQRIGKIHNRLDALELPGTVYGRLATLHARQQAILQRVSVLEAPQSHEVHIRDRAQRHGAPLQLCQSTSTSLQ